MKKLLLLVVFVAATISCAMAREMVYHVGPFDKLSQSGNINVVYRSVPDSAGMAAYDSDIDFSDAIEITNNKGKLSIKEVPGHDMGKLPVIRVYSDYVSQIKSEGNALINADITTGTPTLSLGLVGNGRIICDNIGSTEVSATITTGNGSIVLRGHCTEANFKLTGAGLIQADGLEAGAVKCTVVGTGSIGCWPTKELDVRGVGTTKVYYRGNPTIKKVGGAKIMPMTTETEEEDKNEETLNDDVPTEVTDEEFHEAGAEEPEPAVMTEEENVKENSESEIELEDEEDNENDMLPAEEEEESGESFEENPEENRV